ncbi:MAG: hypothetical protein RLY57_451 [Candidatus Parcubacteria bacterium]|jgi:hypothetical protein
MMSRVYRLSFVAVIILCGAFIMFPRTESYQQGAAMIALQDGYVEEIAEAAKEEVQPLVEFVKIINSCGPYFEGECVNVRSGPGTSYPAVSRLRNDVVLKVGERVERDGQVWVKIIFDEWIRYPERVKTDWYVLDTFTETIQDKGDLEITDRDNLASTTKEIIVYRGEQKLYAYDNGVLFMEASISTGHDLTPTPRGIFEVYKKTPSRYMQGPIPGISDQYYDLAGVPWNLYFTAEGAVIHGAYWHDNFGRPYSHGCVNLSPKDAETLYGWADLGTRVVVKD